MKGGLCYDSANSNFVCSSGARVFLYSLPGNLRNDVGHHSPGFWYGQGGTFPPVGADFV